MPSKKFFSRKRKKKEEENNPWAKPSSKSKANDPRSFVGYVKGVFGSFGHRVSSDVGFFGRKKIHVRFLRQTKRVVAAVLLVLYLLMGLVAVSNPFAILFFVTSFLLLDYLWKSRRVVWEKKK